MDIKMMKLHDLIPYENNPRNNEGTIQYVANSIEKFGFKVPIVIDENNIIVAGHTRWMAADSLNMDEVPVIVADDLTPEQIKAFRLADNKTAEKSSWDFEKLSREISDIEMSFNLPDFGFGDFELDVLKNEANFDEEEFSLPDEEQESTSEDGKTKITIICETEDEEEWLRNMLCVDKLKRTFSCSDLREGKT